MSMSIMAWAETRFPWCRDLPSRQLWAQYRSFEEATRLVKASALQLQNSLNDNNDRRQETL